MNDTSTPTRLWLWLAFGLVFALNLHGISYGLPGEPDAWVHDEIAPWMVQGTLDHGLQSDHWPIRYPPLQFWVLAPVYRAAETVWHSLARAGWVETSAVAHYSMLFYVSRFVSVLMGTAAVLFVYLVGRELGDPLAGLFAALSAGLNLPAAAHAKTGNLDTPALFWLSIALWLFIRVLRHHRFRDYVGLGLTVAAATATKDPAACLFAFAPLPILVSLYRHERAAGRRWIVARLLVDPRLLVPGAAGAALFLLAFGVLESPQRLRTHIEMLGPFADGYAWFDNTLAGQLANLRLSLRNLQFSLGWPASLAAAAGILAWVVRRRDAWTLPLGSALLLGCGYYLTFIFRIRYNFDRYFIPVCMLLALFSGRLLADLWRSRRLAWPARLAVVGVLGFSAAQVLVLDRTLINDARYQVQDYFKREVEPGDLTLWIGDAVLAPHDVWSVQWPGVLYTASFLDQYEVDVVATNVATLDAEGHEMSFVGNLVSGQRGFSVVKRYRYRPLLPLVNVEGTTSFLHYIDPEVVVWRRVPDRRLSRYAELLGATPDRLTRAASKARRCGHAEAATDIDEKRLARDPDNLLARLSLGLDLEAEGCTAEAEDELVELAQRAPGSAAPWLALARLMAGRGQTADAEVAAAIGRDLAPEALESWLTAAAMARQAGAPELATAALANAVGIATSKSDAPGLLEAGWEYQALGAPDAALALLPLARRSEPSEALEREAVALLLACGRDSEALALNAALPGL